MPLTTSNGFKHYYEDTGSGTPLVLVHGATSSHYQWSEHTPAIAERYRVIAPDLRSMGASEHVAELPPTAWVDDVKALTDELGLERFFIGGSSLGSRVAMRFTLTYPERIKALLVDAPLIAISQSKHDALNAGPNRQANHPSNGFHLHAANLQLASETILDFDQRGPVNAGRQEAGSVKGWNHSCPNRGRGRFAPRPGLVARVFPAQHVVRHLVAVRPGERGHVGRAQIDRQPCSQSPARLYSRL